MEENSNQVSNNDHVYAEVIDKKTDESTNEDIADLISRLLIASVEGDADVVEDLMEQNKTNENFKINATNETGNSAIHCAACAGHGRIIECLRKYDADINLPNKAGQTALLCAVQGGFGDVVETLANIGANLNAQDKSGRTALHLACQKKDSALALLLLQLNCLNDIVDEGLAAHIVLMDDVMRFLAFTVGETALHISTRENLVSVLQMLCATGCLVDLKTKEGLTALHIASKGGNIEAVRSLILAGADLNVLTPNGIRAEELATAHGQQEIADLLSNFTSSLIRDRREAVIRQLLPSGKVLDRVRVNVLGRSGVGKTALIESLKCGFIRSFFRRSGMTFLQASNQIASAIEVVPLTAAGDVSLWEFSGYESYYSTYNHFLGDPNAANIVVVSMQNSVTQRLHEIEFWLNFIRARTLPVEPIGFSGSKLWAPRVIIVATHSDLVPTTVDSGSSSSDDKSDGLLEELIDSYVGDLLIDFHLYTVDANQAMGPEMKLLRQRIFEIKRAIREGLPPCCGILDATVATLPEWRRVLNAFPVVTWFGFMEYIRTRVNLLATEDHLRELVNQLQVMGEVQCLARDSQEIVVINPRWLCSDVIGNLLSYETLAKGPENGQFSLDQLRPIIPKTDPSDLICILDALELGTSRQIGGYGVYSVFSFDRTVAPPPELFIDKEVIGGFAIRSECNDQLVHVFPRVIRFLVRRVEQLQQQQEQDDDSSSCENDPVAPTSIAHWSTGAMLVHDSVAGILQLSDKGDRIIVLVSGSENKRKLMFFFQEDLCEAIYSSLESCCPALYLERSPLSIRSIRNASSYDDIQAYQPRDVISAHLTDADSVLLDNNNGSAGGEKLIDIFAFGDTEVFSCLQPGINQSINTLPLYARCRLAAILDDKKADKCWLTLAAALGVKVDAVAAEQAAEVFSPTDGLLSDWARLTRAKATIRDLHVSLKEIGRADAAEVVASSSPLYCLTKRPQEDV